MNWKNTILYTLGATFILPYTDNLVSNNTLSHPIYSLNAEEKEGGLRVHPLVLFKNDKNPRPQLKFINNGRSLKKINIEILKVNADGTTSPLPKGTLMRFSPPSVQIAGGQERSVRFHKAAPGAYRILAKEIETKKIKGVDKVEGANISVSFTWSIGFFVHKGDKKPRCAFKWNGTKLHIKNKIANYPRFAGISVYDSSGKKLKTFYGGAYIFPGQTKTLDFQNMFQSKEFKNAYKLKAIFDDKEYDIPFPKK